MRAWPLTLVCCLLAGAAVAAGLTEADARALAERQTAAWNRGDLGGYFATFRQDAAFTDQTRTGKGEIIRYGTSTLAEARTQSRKLLASSKVTEQSAVERIVRTPDGKSLRVASRVETLIEDKAGRRRVCATREQQVSLSGGRLVSHGRTDTIRRCPRLP